MKRASMTGFTLIEIIITVLIAAILLAVAIPSFRILSDEITFNSIQQKLILDISFSRNEAINQGGNIVMCASSDFNRCSANASNWSSGWIIFVDDNNNASFNTGTDELIRISEQDSLANILWSNNNPIIFNGDGTVTSSSVGSFSICPLLAGSTNVKGIALSRSGRARSSNSVVCP